MALVHGPRPLLFDTGFGADIGATVGLVRGAGVEPSRLALVVNSHYHCDHVGGNGALQRRYRVPIAAFRWDARAVNRRDREACTAVWLDQPVAPYTVDLELSDGDDIDTGLVRLTVLHTPGHTQGHLSLFEPESRTLLGGDLFHADDVAWINPFREGVMAVETMLETLDRIARLRPRWACSGHGPAISEPLAAIDTARRRYASWLAAPERLGWHACKRILTYALMLNGGMARADLPAFLLARGWFQDYSRYVFGTQPAEFVEPLIAEMVRSGAAVERGGRLRAGMRHRTPSEPSVSVPPHDWPPPTTGARPAVPVVHPAAGRLPDESSSGRCRDSV